MTPLRTRPGQALSIGLWVILATTLAGCPDTEPPTVSPTAPLEATDTPVVDPTQTPPASTTPNATVPPSSTPTATWPETPTRPVTPTPSDIPTPTPTSGSGPTPTPAPTPTPIPTPTPAVDADEDGSPAALDCNDGDSAVHPGAAEACNEADDDCDAVIDEGLTGTFYEDADDDGFGDPATAIEGCTVPGTVASGADCDDTDPAIHPDADEVCDGADENCNGEVDEGVLTSWWADIDGDGFGDEAAPGASCDLPADAALDATDCDDTTGDINPDADELCDGVDNNCDGRVDEAEAIDAPLWYLDVDADDFGDDGTTTPACTRPSGYTNVGGDCDDAASTVNPAADERCDELDNNCDGEIDEASAIDAPTLYPDGDLDGYGVSAAGVVTCEDLAGHVEAGGDCDDTDPDFHPGAAEPSCTDPNDYNCDGSTAYADHDDDGRPACQDCDDESAQVYPNAPEICDERDNNCNGQVDEGVKHTYYIDTDNDGYGAAYNSRDACAEPAGYTELGGDCNDFNNSISPGNPEVCDTIDNNCNGQIDEGLPKVATYPDLDGDGHGAIGSRPFSTCLSDENGDGVGETAPYGFSTVQDDCDDSDVLVFTGAPERCDDQDNNCNSLKDEYCFGECGGEWPFKLDYNAGRPTAGLIDMNGDNQFETVVQDAFGFAILDAAGAPLYNYSAPIHNYSRREFVAADIDTYDSFTADTQNIELLTGNGSRPRFYRLNGDKTITLYERTDIEVYDASTFLVADLDYDRRPEFLTTSWCRGDQGVMGFRFDKSTNTINNIKNIPDPDNTCVYTDGRVLTDLNGDGTAELVYGNGYAYPTLPSVWGGEMYAFRFTSPSTMDWSYHCPEGDCFDTTAEGLFGGAVNSIYRVEDDLWTQVTYFTQDVVNAANPSTSLYWAYDTAGQTLSGMPSSSYAPTYPTDINNDGVTESVSDVLRLGLWDLNQDGYPDRIYTNGAELRLALYDPGTKTFVEQTASRSTVSATGISVRSLWDSDGDGRLNVITADDGGTVYCHELGQSTWKPLQSLPPYNPPYLRTNQWDNYEPNEGDDTTGDGIPDRITPVASALTRNGQFYSYLSSAEDVDTYLIDSGWSPNVCVRAPKGKRYKLEVFSYRDLWNNTTRSPTPDGLPDGSLWSGDTAAGGEICFSSGSVTPPRNGEYRFVAKVTSTSGDYNPWWPYWITARK